MLRIAIASLAAALLVAEGAQAATYEEPAPAARARPVRKAPPPHARKALPKRVYYPRAIPPGPFDPSVDVMPPNGPYCNGPYCAYGYPAYGYVYGSPSNGGPAYQDGCGFVWRQVWIPSWGWSVRRRWECDNY